ncbi:MAG: TolC family protein [Desulfovibrio sp.]|nr:TolC family protein [Desulfovibrio sp.]
MPILFFLLLLVLTPYQSLAKDHSISIQKTVQGVLHHHRGIRAEVELKQAMESDLTRAKAGFGPRIDVTTRGGWGLLSDETQRARQLDNQFYGYTNLQAQLVQPIWDGFATRSRVRQAKSSLAAQQWRLFDTATSLSLDGIAAHIDLLRRKAIVGLAKSNVDHHTHLVTLAKDRAAIGMDTTADVTQAHSRLERALAYASDAQAQLHIAEQTYKRVTGMDPHNLAQVPMPPKIFKQSKDVLERAQKHNPRLAAYLEDVRARRAQVEEAQASFYPSLSLEAGPSYTDRGGSTDRWVYSFDVMGVARWNVFASGASLAEKKAAQARTRQARQVMYDYADALKLEIESTWDNFCSAKQQYENYARALAYSKHTRIAYEEQFMIGGRSILDVLDAESEIYSFATQSETARANILLGAYRLLALTGEMLPAMDIDLTPLRTKAKKDPKDKREEFKPGWFE